MCALLSTKKSKLERKMNRIQARRVLRSRRSDWASAVDFMLVFVCSHFVFVANWNQEALRVRLNISTLELKRVCDYMSIRLSRTMEIITSKMSPRFVQGGMKVKPRVSFDPRG